MSRRRCEAVPVHDRRAGAVPARPALCLVPVGPAPVDRLELREAARALTAAGVPHPSAPLAALVARVAREARQCRSTWRRTAIDQALDAVDFDDPLVLGPVVSTTAGLDGGRRAIERQLRVIITDALGHLL